MPDRLADVDWRAMFKNYVLIMWGEEGIDYLDRSGDTENDARLWTEQEYAAIEELQAELRAEREG